MFKKKEIKKMSDPMIKWDAPKKTHAATRRDAILATGHFVDITYDDGTKGSKFFKGAASFNAAIAFKKKQMTRQKKPDENSK